MNYLIINADDFGLCESVNDSILALFLDHKITSFTFMVNMSGSEDALKKINEIKLKVIPVGLHFNIIRGKSFFGKSTITDEQGFFLGRKELFKRILLGKVKNRDITIEFGEQLNFFKRNELVPTHVDSDNHSLSNPFIFKAIKHVLIEEKIPCRKFLPLKFVNFYKKPKRFINQFYLFTSSIINNDSKIKTNDYLTSIYDTNDKELSQKSYLNLIDTNKKNSIIELMVHPYSKSKDLLNFYKTTEEVDFLERCYQEYDVLKTCNFEVNRKHVLKNFKFLS